MSKKELLLSELEQVPEPFLDEVLDFVHFLKTKPFRLLLQQITVHIEETYNRIFPRGR